MRTSNAVIALLMATVLVMLAGCPVPTGNNTDDGGNGDDPQDTNNPPYPIVDMLDASGSSVPDEDAGTPDVLDVSMFYGSTVEFTLVPDTDGSGNSDPDGDTVTYAVVPAFDGAVPTDANDGTELDFTLDAATGIVTFSGDFKIGTVTASFVTVDEHGVESETGFTVRFEVTAT